MQSQVLYGGWPCAVAERAQHDATPLKKKDLKACASQTRHRPHPLLPSLAADAFAVSRAVRRLRDPRQISCRRARRLPPPCSTLARPQARVGPQGAVIHPTHGIASRAKHPRAAPALRREWMDRDTTTLWRQRSRPSAILSLIRIQGLPVYVRENCSRSRTTVPCAAPLG